MATVSPHLRSLDADAFAAARAAVPAGLGRLGEIATRVAGIQGLPRPAVSGKRLILLAADHWAARDDSAWSRLQEIIRARAPINGIVAHGGIDLQLVDCGLEADLEAGTPMDRIQGESPSAPPGLPILHRKTGPGAGDIAQKRAMERLGAEHCVAVGVDLAVESGLAGFSLIGNGVLSSGARIPAAALTCVLTGVMPRKILDSNEDIVAVERALERHQPNRANALDLLETLGGFDIGAAMGMVLGAAATRIPVVCDGLASTAGAALAVLHQPQVRDYLFVGQRSANRGHAYLLEWLQTEPILALGLRDAQGAGAALAMGVVEAAVGVLRG